MGKNKPGNGGAEPSALDPTAAEIDPVAETIRPARTMQVELKGGPLTHQVELLVDGAAPKHITKAVIVAEVGDILRLQTEQIKIIASVSLAVTGWEKKVLAHAAVRTNQDENPVNYIGEGKTTREALLNLVDKIPQEALDE